MKSNLIYYSNGYLDFLKGLLLATDESILISKSNGDSICLPLLVTEGPLGRVANSLPFYGSHGGPYTSSDSTLERSESMLILEERINAGRYASVTIIENPFDPLNSLEIAGLQKLKIVDTRVSQVTHWNLEKISTEDSLLEKFHPKTRNAVRKGLSRIAEVRDCTHDERVIDFLVNEHMTAITLLGGMPKTNEAFSFLQKHLIDNFLVYAAFTFEGELGAVLLVLQFGNTIEYFTPVINPKFRESQILSGLIFRVMLSKFEDGCTLWNWGGTWESQEGVHRFKNRFGSTDRYYRYFNWCDDSISSASNEVLLKEYPYWYTRKFDK